MGRHIEIKWQESEAELKKRFQKEKHPERRTRLQALWLMRRGETMVTVSQMLGKHYRTVQRWATWYRAGGLTEVLQRTTGRAGGGHNAYLTQPQQKTLVARVSQGKFKTIHQIMEWVYQRWGVRYKYKGMYDWVKRHQGGLKVPRPHAAKADDEAQAAWKKGG